MAVINALTILLYLAAGSFLLFAAYQWLKLAFDRKGARKRRTVTLIEFRTAAGATAIAFALLAVAILWSTAGTVLALWARQALR